MVTVSLKKFFQDWYNDEWMKDPKKARSMRILTFIGITMMILGMWLLGII